ncbi:cytochrome o ubiquinol oxidase subunit IV [Coxiella endosymbiont of Amblyomma sculptum]|nr:cytochrome o ubiquinol oxidase subunit IV [Coxiella endosymbiont of Amblyomma sculptum]
MVFCIFFTLISFTTVMYGLFSKEVALSIIFASALVQFAVQVVFFLQMSIKDEQNKMNLISFIFTIVVSVVLIVGSLWILWSLHYRMVY